MTAAAAEGQALVDAARAQAARLLTTAQTAVDDAHTGYTTAHAAALDAGWQPAELTTLGYPPPTGRRRRTRSSTAPQPEAVTEDRGNHDQPDESTAKRSDPNQPAEEFAA